MKKICAILLLMCNLQGCVVAFIAGAAVGGLVIYDRRNIQTFVEDRNMADKITFQISRYAANYPKSHIVVVAFDHVILLVGQAPNDDLKQQAEQIARNMPLVRKVYNEITISGPTSPMTRSSDTWISTKVRATMLAAKDLQSTQINTVTENGVVYLMGTVSSQQADYAVRCARSVAGVQKVVKLFEYSER